MKCKIMDVKEYSIRKISIGLKLFSTKRKFLIKFVKPYQKNSFHCAGKHKAECNASF